MSISKLNLNDLLSIKDEADRLFNEASTFNSWEERYALMASGTYSPQLNTYYRGDDFVIQSNMPEFDKGDIKVSVSGKLLAIGSEVKREREFVGDNAYRYHRSGSSFCKIMELPAGLDTGRMKSTFKNGVLEVIIPKLGRTAVQATDASQSRISGIKPVAGNTFPILKEGEKS